MNAAPTTHRGDGSLQKHDGHPMRRVVEDAIDRRSVATGSFARNLPLVLLLRPNRLFTDDRRWDGAHTALPGMRPLPGSVERTERRRHLPDA